MGKRNKIRYQSREKPKATLQLTGNVYLQYVDDEALATPQKGDLMVYPYNDALHSARMGEYESTGFTGYFKADVYDGWGWRLVLLAEIFSQQENHFSKNERPIDTYVLCREMLQAWGGRWLQKTYREHYEPADETGS